MPEEDSVRIVHSADMEWAASPVPGVWRKRLEHFGPPESGRVTSVVRYDPGSTFTPHEHPEGEEILVLDGVFVDDRGAHPAGTYLLNPEGFRHTPGTDGGCELFVKLRQYPGRNRRQVRLDTRVMTYHGHPDIAGVRFLPLYGQAGFPEEMRLVRLPAGARLPWVPMPGGEEIFVVEGDLSDEHGSLRAGSWARFPPGSGHSPRSAGGCLLYVCKGAASA